MTVSTKIRAKEANGKEKENEESADDVVEEEEDEVDDCPEELPLDCVDFGEFSFDDDDGVVLEAGVAVQPAGLQPVGNFEFINRAA